MLNKNGEKYTYLKVIYKPKEEKEKLRIFGHNFLTKNKGKCIIIYKNKRYELTEFINDIDKSYNYKDLIKLKIGFSNNIIDFSYMFHKCNQLKSISVFNSKESNQSSPKIKENILNSSNNSISFESCDSYDNNPDSQSNSFFDEFNYIKQKDIVKQNNIMSSKTNIYITNMIKYF